ncbi:MAG: polysaccharide deacetylase family protein [Candidatus Binatia bacterium]
MDRIRDPVLDRFCLTTAEFRAQIETLGAVVDFAGVDGVLGGYARRPRALVTFDDAFRTVYTHALPVLRDLGVPAVVCAPVGLVDSQRSVWSLELDLLCRHASIAEIGIPESDGGRCVLPLRTSRERERARRFARLQAWRGRDRFPLELVAEIVRQVGPGTFGELLAAHPHLAIMSSAELRDLCRAGFEIAVHGFDHLALSRVGSAIRAREIAMARVRLGELLGGWCPRVFCLPYGEGGAEAIGEVRREGYAVCLTTTSGRVEDPWLMGRFDGAQPRARLLGDIARHSQAMDTTAE